jgi:hypothetical protein
MAYTVTILFSTSRSLRVIFMSFLIVLVGTNPSEARKKSHKKKRKTIQSRFHPVVSKLENADSPEFRHLLNQWNDLKTGKKSGNSGLLILGDSHNQCEDFGIAFSRYLSDSLQIRSAGRSFVFPYPLARTSHRSDMIFGSGKDRMDSPLQAGFYFF